jgi:hypothetical protein
MISLYLHTNCQNMGGRIGGVGELYAYTPSYVEEKL